jgi:uncharacterized circularly permuted ATP-grasp superfamily protein
LVSPKCRCHLLKSTWNSTVTLGVVADISDGRRLAAGRNELFAAAGERAVPADLVLPVTDLPPVIDEPGWELVARGVRQRVLALEAFLADVYGPGRACDDGVLPWSLVFASHRFRREAAGITPPGNVRVHVAGIDLVRDERGRFRVLGHNVTLPSGVSREQENRLAATGPLPALARDQVTRPADEFPSRLLAALRAAAPPGVADPFVVVLAQGGHDPACYQDSLLARLMGVELVQGRDLSCWRDRVYARTTRGRRPADVICRRVDDDWLDPLHFRPDSRLGCPGLVNAARRGTVTIANAIGSAVADDRRIYALVPDLIRYYLGEEPLLENAAPGPGGGEPAPRRVDLRVLAVNDGADVWVTPGGSTRVVPREGALTVDSGPYHAPLAGERGG